MLAGFKQELFFCPSLLCSVLWGVTVAALILLMTFSGAEADEGVWQFHD